MLGLQGMNFNQLTSIKVTVAADASQTISVPAGKGIVAWFVFTTTGSNATADIGGTAVLDLDAAGDNQGMVGPFVGADGEDLVFTAGATTTIDGAVTYGLINA